MIFGIAGVLAASECRSALFTRSIFLNKICELNEEVDFKLSYDGSDVSPEADLTVVNVLQLASRLQDACHYSFVDVGLGGALRNGYLVFNATVNLAGVTPASCAVISVAPFADFGGTMENVTVTGEIRLEGLDTSRPHTVVLSRFYGAGTTGNAGNVYTDLKYYIGGQLLGLSANTVNQTVDASTVSLVDDFDAVLNPGGATRIPDVPQDKKLSALVNGGAVQLHSVRLGRGARATVHVHAACSGNAFDDHYVTGPRMVLQALDATAGMAVRYYAADGSEVVAPRTAADYAVKVYYDMATTYVFGAGRSPYLSCYAQYYNPATNQCEGACGGKSIGRLCLQGCPDGMVYTESGLTEGSVCAAACPMYDGSYLSAAGRCTNTTSGNVTYDRGYVGNCGSQQYLFGRGCYDSCPYGAVPDDATMGCTVPADCTGHGLLVRRTDTHDFARCEAECIDGTAREAGLNSCTDACMGFIDLDNVCYGSLSGGACSGYTLSAEPGQPTRCLLSCPPPRLAEDGECRAQCTGRRYTNAVFAVCRQCLADVYDGGRYWREDTRVCALQCAVNSDYISAEDDACLIACPNSNGYAVRGSRYRQCLPDCPQGEVPVADARGALVCAQGCPDNHRMVNGVCLEGDCHTISQWEDGHTGAKPYSALVYTDGNTCVTACARFYEQDGGNMRCVASCPNTEYAQEPGGRRCSACVDFYRPDADGNRRCIDVCTGVAYIMAGNRRECVDACQGWVERAQEYQGVFECVEHCPDGSYGEELQQGAAVRYCENTCVSGYYEEITGADGVVDRQCVAQCQYYTDESPVRRCHTVCPPEAPIADSATTPHRCITAVDCAANGRIIDLQGFCVDQCQSGTYWVDNNIARCVTNCSDHNSSVTGRFGPADHRECYVADQDCPAYVVPYDPAQPNLGLCVPLCPKTAPLTFSGANGVCERQCATKYFYENDLGAYECMDEAHCEDPATGYYVKEAAVSEPGYQDYRQCLPQCSGSDKYYDETGATCQNQSSPCCTAACAPGAFVMGFRCVSACRSPVEFNRIVGDYYICVDGCADFNGTEFYEPGNMTCIGCDLKNSFYRLADIYPGERQCVGTCEAPGGYYLAESRQCVDNCTIAFPDTPYADGSECVVACSASKCVVPATGVCEDGHQWFLSDKNVPTCVLGGQCDAMHPFEDPQTLQCTDVCNKMVYEEQQRFFCVQECPGAYPYIENATYCVGRCANYTIEKDLTCVNQCPTDLPYYTNTDKVCLDKCATGDFAHGNICNASACGTFIQDGFVCVDECPSGYVDEQRECVDGCPGYYYVNTTVNNTTNVTAQHHMCVAQCDGTQYPYHTNGSLECIGGCAAEQFIDQQSKTCYDAVVDPYYFSVDSTGRKVLTECPAALRNNETRLCSDTCESGFEEAVAGYCVRAGCQLYWNGVCCDVADCSGFTAVCDGFLQGDECVARCNGTASGGFCTHGQRCHVGYVWYKRGCALEATLPPHLLVAHPDGNYEAVSCAGKMYTADGLCVPVRCPGGRVWVRSGCHEPGACRGQVIDGVCVYDGRADEEDIPLGDACE